MRKTAISRPMKAATPAQTGPAAVGDAISMSQPQAPGGGGFLINHNAFTDARPPGIRGEKKSTGYPNFPTSTPS